MRYAYFKSGNLASAGSSSLSGSKRPSIAAWPPTGRPIISKNNHPFGRQRSRVLILCSSWRICSTIWGGSLPA